VEAWLDKDRVKVGMYIDVKKTDCVHHAEDQEPICQVVMMFRLFHRAYIQGI
jgi:hypothetical protein